MFDWLELEYKFNNEIIKSTKKDLTLYLLILLMYPAFSINSIINIIYKLGHKELNYFCLGIFISCFFFFLIQYITLYKEFKNALFHLKNIEKLKTEQREEEWQSSRKIEKEIMDRLTPNLEQVQVKINATSEQ